MKKEYVTPMLLLLGFSGGCVKGPKAVAMYDHASSGKACKTPTSSGPGVVRCSLVEDKVGSGMEWACACALN